VKDSFGKAGLDVVEFPGVRPNPVLSHLRKGIAIARKEGIEVIAAVGGGSVLDEAKAIAAGAVADTDVWDFFTGKEKIQKTLPVLTVLTLPATGSEMNGGMVITNEETSEKFGFIDPHMSPKVSIMDPAVTCTIPAEYTAFAAVDAVSHLCEGYFTHQDPWAPIQDRYVEGLVKTVMESVEKILLNLDDYQARATMMWAATLAWNGLGLAGVGDATYPNHMLGHPLSAIHDIAHGASLSVVMPSWMRYSIGKGNKRITMFAENIMGVSPEGGGDTASRGVDDFEKWLRKIGAPVTFTEAGMPAGELEKVVENACVMADAWALDKEFTRGVIQGIYEKCGG
jgi:alcohol dehydrogenase YqhD (iron-dependent ADH family)